MHAYGINHSITLLYDGAFDGLLSAVFETYRMHIPAARIVAEFDWEDTLFDEPLIVATNKAWAQRVRDGVIRRTSERSWNMLYRCFLSEQPDADMLIYQFIKLAVESEENIEENFRDETVLRLHQIDKQMGREIHRMHAFIRFQRTRDDLYFAVIEPDFDVLPLIIDHFERRYPAQCWLIYDGRRHYGMYYDEQKTEAVTFSEQHHCQLRRLHSDTLQSEEIDYQQLWQRYFTSTSIAERRNMKLHLQHVPRRYWKYLTEKQAVKHPDR